MKDQTLFGANKDVGASASASEFGAEAELAAIDAAIIRLRTVAFDARHELDDAEEVRLTALLEAKRKLLE